MARPPTLDQLRRYALARSLFRPTTLPTALRRMGFVQADPIRAPARAQDLTLRHRVEGYRAGDLERRYARLAIEEDFFVNYGFLPRELQQLMHPRSGTQPWNRTQRARSDAVLAFVRERGVVHPREVDAEFDHGRSRNWFGGSSRASTELLDGMHYRGWLRVAGRDGGTRLYAAAPPQQPVDDPDRAYDRLVDVVLALYAPMPERSIAELVYRLRYGVPQWADRRRQAMQRLRERAPQAAVDGERWYWPEGDDPCSRRHGPDEALRLLAPFDPVVWDRRRFERFWGWAYRFEAYTPAPRRERGYYALPLSWRGGIDGWANASVEGERLIVEVGWQQGSPPADASWRGALEQELSRMAVFLGLDAAAFAWSIKD